MISIEDHVPSIRGSGAIIRYSQTHRYTLRHSASMLARGDSLSLKIPELKNLLLLRKHQLDQCAAEIGKIIGLATGN